MRRPDRDTLTYALEVFLPLDVDRLVCDFVRTGNGRHLGVAVETARVKPIVEGLVRRGINVERIELGGFAEHTLYLRGFWGRGPGLREVRSRPVRDSICRT